MTKNLIKNITLVTGLAVIGFAGNGCREYSERARGNNPNYADPKLATLYPVGDQDGITSNQRRSQKVVEETPNGYSHFYRYGYNFPKKPNTPPKYPRPTQALRLYTDEAKKAFLKKQGRH